MLSKQAAFGILIKTNLNGLFKKDLEKPENLIIFESTSIKIKEFLESITKQKQCTRSLRSG
jgi:hypothetical protein